MDFIDSIEELSKPSERVSLKEGREIARKLIKFAETHNRAAQRIKRGTLALGLAAPQVGIRKCVCIVKIGGVFQSFINPEIVLKSPIEIGSEEMCLSFPGRKVNIQRSIWVEVAADNVTGTQTYGLLDPADRNPYRLLTAVCVQHELDHLQGVTILSYLPKKGVDSSIQEGDNDGNSNANESDVRLVQAG